MPDVDESSPEMKKRPLWARGLNRSITFVLNSLLWLGLWIGAFVALFIAIRSFSDSAWLNSFQGTAHLVAEIAVRALFVVPLAVWIMLMIHPIRTRWWLVQRVASLGPRLRRVRQPATSAPLEPAPAPQSSAAPAPAAASGLLQPTRPPRPLSRRRFLGESALFGGLMTYSMFVEPFAVQAVEVDIPVPNLPDRFVGMRVAQMSDLHINSYTTAEDLERAVAVVNSLNPDLVMLTGDFVDWDAKYADDATRPFRDLTAREGVFAVLGNHDYYSGDIERVKRSIKQYDLGLLVNQHTTIRRGADTLTLIGLDDPRHNRSGNGPRMSAESIDPERAMRGMPAQGPHLLMVHNPILIPELVQRYELDLITSGHTHGGQFQVPILTDRLVASAEYFVKGRYDLGRTQVYVNRGFGFTGPPIRFRARPEITLLRLVRA